MVIRKKYFHNLYINLSIFLFPYFKGFGYYKIQMMWM